MSKKQPFDLSKFKHVSSDAKSTKLKHKDGHFLVVMHKALDKDGQEQFKALAKGGKVKKPMYAEGTTDVDSEIKGYGPRHVDAEIERQKKHAKEVVHPTPQPDNGVDVRTPEQKAKAAEVAKANGYADGGRVMYAQGSGVLDKAEEYLRELGESTGLQAGQRGIPQEGSKPIETEPREGETNPDARARDTRYGGRAPKQAQSGEVRKMYADGTPDGILPEIVPSYADPLQANAPQPSGAPVLDEVKQVYNRIVSNKNPKGLTAPVSAYQFSPEGTPPKILDPKAALAAKDEAEIHQANAQMDEQEKANEQLQAIEAKKALGLPTPEAAPPLPGDMGPTSVSQVAEQQRREPTSIERPDPRDPETMLSSGYNKAMQGINQQATAQGQLGEAQAKMLDDQVKAQTEARATYQQHYNELEQERQAHMSDIKNGYIDPDQYWTGRKDPNTGEMVGGHSKIAAGIGMILAGFNPTNSPNAAVNFLKYQMDQNIEAQKQNLGAKQNLLTANLRQFGNLKDATDMTRIMQNDIMTHELQSAAAKAQTPLAKAAALQAAGKLQMDTAPMFQQFAMRRAMMNLANNPSSSPQATNQMIGYMRVMNPEMAKEMESRYIPGVGLAQTPVPQDVRQELIGKQNFDQMAREYINFAKSHSGSWSPSDIKKGAAMAGELQGAYRQASKGGVYKEGEQSFIETLIPSDPTQYLGSLRTLPKVEQLIHNNMLQGNNLRQGYGLPPKAVQQDSQQSQIKTVNGVKYMRGPNGEAIRVK